MPPGYELLELRYGWVVLLAYSHYLLCADVCMPQGIQAAVRLPIISYLSVVPHLRLRGCDD